MAKGNMLQGQATGKVGDIVFMVRNGQQISRVYTASGGRGGDQASIAVRRQRVRFGAASNQYLLYRNIVRGMYRTGKQTRQSDYNYFVRENVDLLPYLTKEENAAGVRCAMPGTFSRGTLGSIIYDFKKTASGGTVTGVEVKSESFTIDTATAWDSNVRYLKARLAQVFPNARKVNFCVCRIIKSEVVLPNGTQFSHTFDRGDVVFDLYEEDPIVGDDQSIADYFMQYAPQYYNDIVFQAVTGNIWENDTIFKIATSADITGDMLDDMFVMIFATNDQVGDCYTSILNSIITPNDDGGLSLYSTLRTDNHKQIAEDSYGYATGVMRTNIQQA